MPQLSLYLDNETMKLMQQNAESKSQSMSSFVADLIRENVADSWPADYWELYGSIADESFQRPDQPAFSLDCARSDL